MGIVFDVMFYGCSAGLLAHLIVFRTTGYPEFIAFYFLFTIYNRAKAIEMISEAENAEFPLPWICIVGFVMAMVLYCLHGRSSVCILSGMICAVLARLDRVVFFNLKKLGNENAGTKADA
jgi:hypothetical protein